MEEMEFINFRRQQGRHKQAFDPSAPSFPPCFKDF
jgi:hypothetical protein